MIIKNIWGRNRKYGINNIHFNYRFTFKLISWWIVMRVYFFRRPYNPKISQEKIEIGGETLQPADTKLKDTLQYYWEPISIF